MIARPSRRSPSEFSARRAPAGGRSSARDRSWRQALPMFASPPSKVSTGAQGTSSSELNAFSLPETPPKLRLWCAPAARVAPKSDIVECSTTMLSEVSPPWGVYNHIRSSPDRQDMSTQYSTSMLQPRPPRTTNQAKQSASDVTKISFPSMRPDASERHGKAASRSSSAHILPAGACFLAASPTTLPQSPAMERSMTIVPMAPLRMRHTARRRESTAPQPSLDFGKLLEPIDSF